MKKFLEFLAAWFAQSFIAVDQAINAIVMPLFTWTIGYADETLSARAWRMYDTNRIWGRVLMPVIDLLFSWQTPDPGIKDAAGNVITRHCQRACAKEVLRRGLPPEYR